MAKYQVDEFARAELEKVSAAMAKEATVVLEEVRALFGLPAERPTYGTQPNPLPKTLPDGTLGRDGWRHYGLKLSEKGNAYFYDRAESESGSKIGGPPGTHAISPELIDWATVPVQGNPPTEDPGDFAEEAERARRAFDEAERAFDVGPEHGPTRQRPVIAEPTVVLAGKAYPMKACDLVGRNGENYVAYVSPPFPNSVLVATGRSITPERYEGIPPGYVVVQDGSVFSDTTTYVAIPENTTIVVTPVFAP